MNTSKCLAAGLLLAASTGWTPAGDTQVLPAQTHQQWIQSEWFNIAGHDPFADPAAPVTTREDAAGACDGVIDGKWGFHTSRDSQPWWHVDLGAIHPLTQVRIWNRSDREEIAARARHLRLLLSDDGKTWREVYRHNGEVFFRDPLTVPLDNAQARFVRVQLRGTDFLHLDEVEVFGVESKENLALNKPADQSSVSQWSTASGPLTEPPAYAVTPLIERARKLALERQQAGIDVESHTRVLDECQARLEGFTVKTPAGEWREVFLAARGALRGLMLSDPLLDFDTILITKRVPGSYNHMSDQYYGWWSRPGGGIYLLRNFKGDSPAVESITDSFAEPGSFLRPALSYDGKKVLFAWCKHYPHLAAEPDKLNKANVPEDAFYHIFEMNIDGTGVRQLTRGKYDNFDARYLPDGRIVFLSTRRGQFIQAGRESAARTVAQPDLPDIYVRCGGDARRPVPVYTLHTMNADGGDLVAISPFEMFEWEPSVASDGAILYSRWDYVDRDNMPYMSLWAINPDGTNARLVYGNYTHAPHCTFEPRSIPDSPKIIFTGSAHHAQTMGSLVLLDPSKGTEKTEPITRLTPGVVFPEIEGWPNAYFANPWPLSERLHLVSWGVEPTAREGLTRPPNGMGIYLFDAEAGLEPLFRDPAISSMYPIPVRSEPVPPAIPSVVDWDGPQEGRFLLTDVYRGLRTVERGRIKALRVIAVPGKTQPWMNNPSIGLTRDDPGKAVLGTVPVEADGSAFFRVPSGVAVFFQALDGEGMAVQTMRSATHVQPGSTLSCAGCHESRLAAPPTARPLAALREPSRLTVGPEGSWPLRFDRLVQPVLDRHCSNCHHADSPDRDAARFVLTADKAYDSLVHYGDASLAKQILAAYWRGHSIEGQGPAMSSVLLELLTSPGGHHGVELQDESLERLIVWMDTYAQRSGSFSEEQERELEALRAASADLLIERRVQEAASR